MCFILPYFSFFFLRAQVVLDFDGLDEEEANLMEELAGCSAKWKETLSRRVQVS